MKSIVILHTTSTMAPTCLEVRKMDFFFNCIHKIKVINQTISYIKIPLLIVVFFMWIHFLERSGFVITSLVSFNLIVLINSGLNISFKKIILYMILGRTFILLLYFGFKNLLEFFGDVYDPKMITKAMMEELIHKVR